MTTHFKPNAQPNETRSTTATCKGIARINGRRAAQLMVTTDLKAVTCERCLAKIAKEEERKTTAALRALTTGEVSR